MKRTTTALNKLLAVGVGMAVFYLMNIGLDKLLVNILPVGMGLSFDQTLEGYGINLPVPALFTITKLVSAFFAGAVGAYILKRRNYFLLVLPVVLLELPLLYVAFGEGSWMLLGSFLLASMAPAVLCCMLGVWLTGVEDNF